MLEVERHVRGLIAHDIDDEVDRGGIRSLNPGEGQAELQKENKEKTWSATAALGRLAARKDP
jgi:hypothetical protein